MATGAVLDVHRADPFTARLDDVLGPVGDLQVAVFTDGSDVPGAEPAVRPVRSRFVQFEIAAADPGSTDHEFARALAVPRQFIAVIVDDFHCNAEHAVTLPGLYSVPVLRGELLHRRTQRADRAEGAHLGHAPGLHERDAELLVELSNHAERDRGAPHQGALERFERQPVLFQVSQQQRPDGRDTGREGDLLVVQQRRKRSRVAHFRPRENQFRADHRRVIGQAPGIGVEHGHHGQDAVLAAQPDGVGHAACIGVQHGGAVAVEDAFRVAGGTGGVAERAC